MASTCRSRLLRRYVSYTQPQIPIFYCSKNSVSRIQSRESNFAVEVLGPQAAPTWETRGCTSSAEFCYTKLTRLEDLMQTQLAQAPGQKLKCDECSFHESIKQWDARRQTSAEFTVQVFEDL